MTKLDELLQDAGKTFDVFYQRVIELHNNRELRLLANQANEGGRIYLIGSYIKKPNLFYDSDGFNATVATECLDSGSYRESASFSYAEKIFRVVGGKLIVNAGTYGKQEMLDVFPQLTIETIEEKLAKAIESCQAKKKEEE